VTDLPYGKCKIKGDLWLVAGQLKKIVKKLFRQFTLNRRRREQRGFLFCAMMKKRVTCFSLKSPEHGLGINMWKNLNYP